MKHINTMNIKFLYILLITFVCITVSSCSSSKSALGTSGADEREFSSSKDRLREVILRNSNEWTTVSVPVKFELKSPANISASAKAYLQRDSSIYFSVKFFGMEVAVLDIRNDSIIALDKYHKYYAAEKISDLLANISFDINSMQSLLLGHPFTHSAHITNIKQTDLFRTEQDSISWTVTPKKQNPLAEYTFTFDNSNNIPSQTTIETAIGKITTSYANVTRTSIGDSPQFTNINIAADKIKAQLSLRWSWENIRTDNPSDIKHVSIPAGYKRIDSVALLKALISQ